MNTQENKRLTIEEWKQIENELFNKIVVPYFTCIEDKFNETANIIFNDIRDVCPSEIHTTVNLIFLLGNFNHSK